MKTIVVCNQKGGVGKTLISDELVFSFERTGHLVNFYDLDGQGGAVHETSSVPGAVVSVVDTPGALTEDLKSALGSADLVVLPMRASSRDMEPVLRTRKIIQQVTPQLPVIYVINAWNRFSACSDFHAWLKKEVGEDAVILLLPQSEAFVQAGAAGVSVVEFARKSHASTSVLELCNMVRKCLKITCETSEE